MAECCSRCSQERRFIRKELQRWGKNMVMVVGMERVAQELMGGRKWRKLMAPMNCLETKEPQDWTRPETCCFCKTKYLDNQPEVVPNETNEPSSTAPGETCSSCGLVSSNSEPNACRCKTTSTQANDQPLDLTVHSRHKTADNQHSDDASDFGDITDHSLIKVPQPSSQPTAKTNKRSRLQTNSVWKRTYTEEELQAALRDIQSGKLGTRRAAVIYGIPRSTLRNKVYKLALDRTNGKRRVNSANATTATTAKTSLMANNKNNKKTVNSTETKNVRNQLEELNSLSNSTSASESLKQILKKAITQRANNNLSTSSSANSLLDKSSLLAESATSSLNLTDLYTEEAFATIQMLSTLESGNTLAPLFTQFLLNIHQLALAKHQTGDNLKDLTTLMTTANLPMLPQLIQKMAETRFVQERSTSDQHLSSETNEENDDENGNNSNVILKVPSFKPSNKSATLSTSSNVTSSDNEPVNSNKLCTTSSSQQESDDFESKSVSLKEIIAKSISQRLTGPAAQSATKSGGLFTVSEDSEGSDALTCEERNNLSGADGKSSTNQSDHSNPSTPEKRNRPKRGRYRNYNRDDLAKAVRAVQRGEMSVHRAGTLFGVPHSTLEYKVKERHLLRPKKRNQENVSITSKKESTSKTSCANSTNNLRSLNGTTSNGTSTSSVSSVNSASNLPIWQASFPFFPIDVTSSNSTNFFASNMMRRLQENARLNQDLLHNHSSESNKEFGGLLLESLIKSSLDNTSLVTGKSKVIKKEEVDDDDVNGEDSKSVLNTSLAVLKEVSAMDKKE